MGVNMITYALARVVSVLVGGAIAFGLALLAAWLVAGAMWPVFLLLAGCWAYLVIDYVRLEAKDAKARAAAQ
jgi:hypothetical protein